MPYYAAYNTCFPDFLVTVNPILGKQNEYIFHGAYETGKKTKGDEQLEATPPV